MGPDETDNEKRPIILIVDDDAGDRALHKRLLGKSMDCEFREAESVAEGLFKFGSESPDIVLLDYHMGAETALDFLERVPRERGQPAPVVVLTGEGNESVAVNVMRYGALDYLPKNSVNEQSLHRATINALEKAGMYRELRRKTEDLARARVAAESANQAKGAFLANVSHEIRTPLTAIMGYAEELLDRDITADARDQAAACVFANSEHLLHLINDLLDLSKIEAGKLAISRQAVSPVEAAEMVCQLLETRARERGIALELERLTAVPKAIDTDPTRLRQILFNLVGNAIKFTSSGSVRVTMRFVDGSDPMLEFGVVDTGIGMTAEQVEKLFRPFVQAEESITSRFGGTGLGLSIGKQLAELLGGRITVASQLGKGSTFTLHLPARAVDAADMLAPDASPRQVFEQHRPQQETADPRLTGRILLAEDVPANRVLIERILQRFGAEVTAVENGAQAADEAMVQQAVGTPFDVVLMDMQMPVMNGYQATSKLRNEGYTGTIIALTADAMVEDVERCRAAGCDSHAAKPIKRKVLLEALAEYMPAG